MEVNGTNTFEEYEKKWYGENLNWQMEEKKKKLELKKTRSDKGIEW